MDDLQSWWEVPSIAHFCSLFRVAFNLLDFDIEELEEALLTDGVEINGSSLLQELIVRLLSGCFGNNGVSITNYQMYLRRLFRTRCREQGRKNPFNSDVDFQCLPLRTKVEILHALCDFRLDADDVVDVLKNLDSDSLRVHPLGFDSLKSAYWYFYGTRLYREDYPKRKKKKLKEDEKGKGKKKSGYSSDDGEDSSDTGGSIGKWQVICYTESDWARVTKSFSNSTSKEEQALYSVLSDDFLPEIPRLFAEKERLQRKRLAESAQRRTSSRIEKLKKQALEEETRREAAQALAVKQQGEKDRLKKLNRERVRRERRALRRSKSGSDDDSSDDSSQALLTSSGSVGGRQTNNSLASATGQIYIQSSKQKVSTSHLFRRTREDLMTGLYKVLDKLKTHQDAWPFADPVEEQYAPRYYSVIARPMDLQTMEDKLDNGEYGSLQQFREDFQLIVDNCRQYNGSDNDYTRMALRLHNSFMNLIDKYLEAEGSSQDDETEPKRHRRQFRSSDMESEEEIMDIRMRKGSDESGEEDKDLRERRILRKSSDGESEEENRDPKGRRRRRKGSDEDTNRRIRERPHVGRGRPRKIREEELFDDEDSERETLVERNRGHDRDRDRMMRKPLRDPPSPSNSTQSLRSRSPGMSDSDGSVTTLSSKSYKDEDWKHSRYNYKRDKPKNKKYLPGKSRVRKRMRRKEKEEEQPIKRPIIDDNIKTTTTYDSEFDDLDDSDERLSILDNVETSGSEEILDTSDEDSDEDSDEEEYERKSKKLVKKPIKKTTVIRNPATLDELDEVTEQVLKDITKWLDEAPRFSDFSSNSNSPLHIPFPEEGMPGIDPEMRRRYHHHHHSEKHVRPRDRFSNDLHRRKIFREQVLKRQRTIDRLQPGKSKGNLLSKENLQETAGPTDTAATTEKEGNTPKLSLGKVLPTDLLSFGIGDSDRKEVEEEVEEKEKKEKEEEKEEPKEEIKEEKVKEEEVEAPAKEQENVEEEKKVEVEKVETKKEKPTPNLSAWFKAFGAPKSQATVPKKKTDNEEKDSKGKEDESTNDDDKDKNCLLSPARRQRRTSTGSSVSERSSFSQDQFDGNSPRPSIDEPYLSPQQEIKSYHHSPINGTLKVGFYQDTCFPKGSSEKSSSPRDIGSSPRDMASVSPRTPYCSPRNTQSTSPRDLSSNPRDYPGASPQQYPPYNSVPAFHPSYQPVPRYPPHIPYYDSSSKPIVDQFTKNERERDKAQLSMYPVKKRGYNEVEQSPKTPEPPSAFKSGSFTPTKDAVERERTFAPAPGRMPTQGLRIPETGLLPPHIRLMEAYQHPDDRHYLGSEPLYSKSPAPPSVYSQNNYTREQQQNYDSVQNYNRVLSPFHSASVSRPENHFPPDHKMAPREVHSPDNSAPLNFSNSSDQSKKDDYPPRVQNDSESPIDYGKSSELLAQKVSSQPSLPYVVNRLSEMPAKVSSPYNRPPVSDLPRTLEYPSEAELKMGVQSLYKNQPDLMAGKSIYNHPMDLMQGSTRYNYQMELNKSVYNQAMQLELMQGKSSPYLVQGGLYNRADTTASKPMEHKEQDYSNKNEPKVKKSRKKKNEVPPGFQQYTQEPKPTGSAFNFGPPLKDNYSTYLDEMRVAGASYYAQQETGANAKPPGSYFLRPPTTSYPHSFMNAQYQQLLQRHPDDLLRPMMLHQGLLPPATYPPGYLPMHDAINRHSWL